MRSAIAIAFFVCFPACAAVYPEVQTPLREVLPGKQMDAPKGVYWLAFKEATVPEKTRDGRAWQELGNKLPDPYAILFVNGKELIKTNPESNTLHPTWPDSPRGNFRIDDSDRLRIELWNSGLIHEPVCVSDLRGNEEEWVALKQISVDCDSGARVVVSFEPPHGKIGYGFYYELRTEAPYVSRVFELSPAAKAGLKAGDLLAMLGDRSSKGMKPGEISAFFNKPEPEGVAIQIRHANGETANVQLKEGPVYPLFTEVGAFP